MARSRTSTSAEQQPLTEQMAQTATLLITVGSTLFPSLTDLALSPLFLERLAGLGADELVVQYGRAEPTFPPGADWVERDHKAGLGRFIFQAGKQSESRKVHVRVMRFTNDFEGLVKQAKWVISHAGSGSILTILRTPRPLLVVPNTDLMDNHQAELADALGDDEYLLVSAIPDLLDNLPRLLDAELELKPFPAIDRDAFAAILDETAGF